MKHITEITLSNHRVSKKRQWEILTDLYKEIFFKDKNWHFFHEIFTNIIRFSTKYLMDVVQYLDKAGVKYEVKGPWIDNQPITKKYQKHFKYIFHANSEMIMKMALSADQENVWRDIYLIADRLSHCFILNCNYIADTWKKAAKRGASWESFLMSQIAADRSSYISQCAKEFVEKGCSMDGYETDYCWAYENATNNGGKVE